MFWQPNLHIPRYLIRAESLGRLTACRLMCLSDVNSRKSKADTFARVAGIYLGFSARNSTMKCGELGTRAWNVCSSRGIFATRIVGTFVVTGDRGTVFVEFNWPEFMVFVEHDLSFDDGVDNLKSKRVKLGVQVVEDRRDCVGPNLYAGVMFVLRGLSRVFVRLDEHATWRSSSQLFDDLMTSRVALPAAWGQRKHFTFNFERRRKLRQSKRKVSVSRATAKIFRLCCSSKFAQLSHVGEKPKQPLPDLRQTSDGGTTRPSVWSTKCLAMRTKERGCETLAIKKQISSFTTLFSRLPFCCH